MNNEIATGTSIQGIKRDLEFLYGRNDVNEVSQELIDVLQNKIPEGELRFIVNYLNERL